MQTNKKPGRDAAGYASCTGNVRRVVLPVLMVFGLTACSASLPDFSTTNISMLGGFTKEEEKADAGYEVVLAKQAAALNPRSPVEATIRDILELAEQKRFTEARNVLAELRESQPRRSDGYRASTATMALLALKAGDFPMSRCSAPRRPGLRRGDLPLSCRRR